MRSLFTAGLTAALLCLPGITRDAGATVTIALEWSGCGGGSGCSTATGTDTIFVNVGGGQTLRLDVYLSHDLTQGMESHTFSLNFDTSLDNELNLGPMAQLEWAGTDTNPGGAADNYAPLTGGLTTLDSSGAGAGRINSFESASLGATLPRNGFAYTVGTSTATAPARYRVGQAFFTVNGATNDGTDIFSGLFNGLFDLMVDGNGVTIPPGTIIFRTATVGLGDPIPEPGTAALLGLGLVGLVLARRRGRRS